MPIIKSLALAGTVASLVAGAAAATELTFIDGGYAEMCSSLAHNLDARERVELTGSRMSMTPRLLKLPARRQTAPAASTIAVSSTSTRATTRKR